MKRNIPYYSPDVTLRTNTHDRFLLIDQRDVYHIGASLKDLGKKIFAFSRLNLPPATILGMLSGGE